MSIVCPRKAGIGGKRLLLKFPAGCSFGLDCFFVQCMDGFHHRTVRGAGNHRSFSHLWADRSIRDAKHGGGYCPSGCCRPHFYVPIPMGATPSDEIRCCIVQAPQKAHGDHQSERRQRGKNGCRTRQAAQGTWNRTSSRLRHGLHTDIRTNRCRNRGVFGPPSLCFLGRGFIPLRQGLGIPRRKRLCHRAHHSPLHPVQDYGMAQDWGEMVEARMVCRHGRACDRHHLVIRLAVRVMALYARVFFRKRRNRGTAMEGD